MFLQPFSLAAGTPPAPRLHAPGTTVPAVCLRDAAPVPCRFGLRSELSMQPRVGSDSVPN